METKESDIECLFIHIIDSKQQANQSLKAKDLFAFPYKSIKTEESNVEWLFIHIIINSLNTNHHQSPKNQSRQRRAMLRVNCHNLPLLSFLSTTWLYDMIMTYFLKYFSYHSSRFYPLPANGFLVDALNLWYHCCWRFSTRKLYLKSLPLLEMDSNWPTTL